MSTRSDGAGRGTTGDAEDERLLDEFRLHAAAEQAALSRALQDSDLPEVARLAHRFRGACQLVGAVDFARFCAEVERAARHGDSTAIATLRDRLPEALLDLSRYVERRCAAANRAAPPPSRRD